MSFSVPVSLEYRSTDLLVIGVTGFGRGFGLRPDDFFQQSGLNDASRIVICDHMNRACLAGLPPDFPTFSDLLSFLKEQVRRLSPERLIVTGYSAGGHSALLLGHLLRADEVIAFAPFTYLSRREAERLGDRGITRVHEKRFLTEEIREYRPEVAGLLDLRRVLSAWNGVTNYTLHVSRYREWDFRRAAYLEDVPGVNIIAHPYAVHSVALSLARDGGLQACFRFPYERPRALRYYLRHLEANPATQKLLPLLNWFRRAARRFRLNGQPVVQGQPVVLRQSA